MASDRITVGKQIYDYFVRQGLAPHQAAAVAGNMAWEGGGRTDLVNPGDNFKNSPMSPHSVGIGQWNDRAPALISFARQNGIELPSGDTRDARHMQEVIRRIPLETQMAFAWNEMQGPERAAYQRVTSGGDVRSAAEGAISYHRPAGWTRNNPSAGHGFDGRVGLANQILATATVNPSQNVAGGQPASPASSPEAAPERPPATLLQASAQGNPQMDPIMMLMSKIFGGGQAQASGADATGAAPAVGGMDRGQMQDAMAKQAMQGGMQQQAPNLLGGMPQRTPVDLNRLRQVIAQRSRAELGV